MALRKTDFKSPIRSQAESILRKLIACADNVNKKFCVAFMVPDAEFNLPEKIYTEIWLSLRKNICDLAEDKQISDIIEKFDEFKAALPNCYHEFNRLSVKKKNAFNALIDFYKVLAIQRFLLERLTTLGGNLHESEQKSRNASLNATVMYMKARDKGLRVKQELQEKISEIERSQEALAKKNPIISRYSAMLNEEVDQLARSLTENVDVLRREYQAFIHDFRRFNEKFADLRQRRYEAVHSPDQASQRNIRDSRLNEIKRNLKTLDAHLKTIQSKNILAFENDLRNPNGTLAEINSLENALSDFEKTHKEKESELNVEEDQFRQEFVSLQRRLQELQNPDREFAKKIDAFLLSLTQEIAERYLTPFNRMADVSKFSLVDQAETVYSFLRQHEYDLLKTENDLQVALRNNKEIVKDIGASKSLHYIQEIKRTGNLGATVKHRRTMAAAVLTIFDKQYSDFYAVINADEKNLKSKWVEAAEAVTQAMETTERDIQTLQDAINVRTREEEIHAISHNIDYLSDDISREIRDIQNLRMSFTETVGKYERLKQALAEALRTNLETMYVSAKSAVERAKQDAKNDLIGLRYEIESYTFSISPEEQKIKLVDDKKISTLKSEVQNLRAAYHSKIVLLQQAQANRERQARLRELDEIEKETRRYRQDADVERGVRERHSSHAKPGFFRRYWKAITTVTVSFALTGAAAGAAVGVFAAVFGVMPTLGLGMIAIPVCVVAGLLIGALTGFGVGVAGAAFADCCCGSSADELVTRPVTRQRSSRNYGTRQPLLNSQPSYRHANTTTNIHGVLDVNPKQHFHRPASAALTARELGIPGIEELDPTLPALRVELGENDTSQFIPPAMSPRLSQNK